MRKFFPLILAIAIGLGGYFYFNPKVIATSKVDKVVIYTYDEYKSKKPLPFIKLDKSKRINTVLDTINNSEDVGKNLGLSNANYILDIIYLDKSKETFFLWLNENTNNAMYQNKRDKSFYILSTEDTNGLKTLIFR